MKFIQFLAVAFIRVFGITEPQPAQLRAASWFIVGMLCAVVVFVTIAGITLHGLLYR